MQGTDKSASIVLSPGSHQEVKGRWQDVSQVGCLSGYQMCLKDNPFPQKKVTHTTSQFFHICYFRSSQEILRILQSLHAGSGLKNLCPSQRAKETDIS